MVPPNMRVQKFADSLVGLFVPKLTAAAAPCYTYTETVCRSWQCSSTSNRSFVQYQERRCDSWACGTGWCSPWANKGCCSI